MNLLKYALTMAVIFILACEHTVTDPLNPSRSKDPRLSQDQWIDLCTGEKHILEVMKQDAELKSILIDLLSDDLLSGQLGFDLLSPGLLKFEFTDGRYILQVDDKQLIFSFAYAGDCGDHKAGDPIIENVFAFASYVTDVHIHNFDLKFKEGPLFCLIENGITFEWPSYVRINLEIENIAISFETQLMDLKEDTVMIRLKSDWQKLSELVKQYKVEKVVRSMPDPFIYYYKDFVNRVSIRQLLYREDDYWVFDPESFVISEIDSITVYARSYLHELEEFWTVFYADSTLQELLGTAKYSRELTKGSLSLESGEFIDLSQDM